MEHKVQRLIPNHGIVWDLCREGRLPTLWQERIRCDLREHRAKNAGDEIPKLCHLSDL